MRTTVLGLLLVGCQTYDFEPTQPVGIAQQVKVVEIGVLPPKPALFLVVDKSGSMTTEVSPGVSRMAALQSAMGTFLTQSGGSAHLGMLPFPNTDAAHAGNACAAGDIANVAVPLDQGNEDPARLAAAAMTVKAEIDGLTAAGGTPTAATMRTLATYGPMLARDRDRFAVLLTDGLPNCNPDDDVNTCSCTTTGLRPCSSGGFNLCLDDQQSADDIALLAVKGIHTIVIGFGTDVMGSLGGAALAKMAAAGNFTRPCKSNADCNAGDTCNGGGMDLCGRPASTCGQSYFQAGNAAELGKVLDAIRDSVTCPPCTQLLATKPTDPRLISVLVDGVPVESGADTWQYRDTGTSSAIEFVGALCQQLTNTTKDDPRHVEIRVVDPI